RPHPVTTPPFTLTHVDPAACILDPIAEAARTRSWLTWFSQSCDLGLLHYEHSRENTSRPQARAPISLAHQRVPQFVLSATFLSLDRLVRVVPASNDQCDRAAFLPAQFVPARHGVVDLPA